MPFNISVFPSCHYCITSIPFLSQPSQSIKENLDYQFHGGQTTKSESGLDQNLLQKHTTQICLTWASSFSVLLYLYSEGKKPHLLMGQFSSYRSLRTAIKSPFNCLLDETKWPSSLCLSGMLFCRLGRELISHQPFQFRCNLDPVHFIHWCKTSVPCFLLTSSLRRLLFTSSCLTLNICYLWSFTNGHHNPLHSLLQNILCVVSVPLTVSGQEGHAWCCACKSTIYACSDRRLLLKRVFSQ